MREDVNECIFYTYSDTSTADQTSVIPAESQRGQQQDHKDQESVAFMHCGPVLS